MVLLLRMLKTLPVCTSGPAPDIWQRLVFQIFWGTVTSHTRHKSSPLDCIDCAEAQSHVLSLLSCQNHSKRRSITSSCPREESERTLQIPATSRYPKVYIPFSVAGRSTSIPLFATANNQKRGLPGVLLNFWRRSQRGFLSWLEDTLRQGYLIEAELLGREAYEEEKEEMMWLVAAYRISLKVVFAGNSMLICS